jgi:hypothetical protein
MPHGYITNLNGQLSFALSFNRRTDDDSLNYQVLNLNSHLQTASVAWTDALPYSDSVAVNSEFEQVTYISPMPISSQNAAFLQVVVTRR